MTTTTRCVLYTRSSKDQADISPETQRKQLAAYAAEKGWKIVGEFSDAAVSAKDNPSDRARMINELKNKTRGWDTILALDSSRIARDADLAGVIHYEIRKYGCAIHYAKNAHTGNSAMDGLIAGVMRAIDAFHSELSREKGLAGLKTNIANGHRAGGRAPIGYRLAHVETGARRDGEAVKKSHLVLDPEMGPRVKQFLKLRLKGWSRTEAAAKAGLSKEASSLIGVERNALTYAGHTVYNQRTGKAGDVRYRPRAEWDIQEKTHTPMISEAEAERLLRGAMPDPARGPRRKGPSGDFLLSGFLFTPSGAQMVSSGDGYYRAGKGRRVPARVLDAVVMSEIEEDIGWHEFADQFISEAKRAADAIVTDPEKLSRERKTAVTKLNNLLRVAEKAPDSPTLAERIREAEAEVKRIEGEIVSAADRADVKRWLGEMTREQAQAWLAERMERAGQTVAEQRAVLAQLVERVEFDPATGRGQVHYHLQLAGRKFNLAEVANEIGAKLASPPGFEPRLPP